MELKIKCSCGNIFRVNAGDSVQDGLYIWYASYFCDKCGQRMEVDGYDIDSISHDVRELIMEKEGEWGLTSSANKIKINYLMKRVLQCENVNYSHGFIFIGTRNQVKWIKEKLMERGLMESDLILKSVVK